MKRVRALAAVAALGMALVIPAQAQAYTRPTATRPPAAVTLTSVTETCVNGYTSVTVDLKANVAGDYDIWTRGDNQFQTYVVEYDTFTAGEVYETAFAPAYPEQVDVVVTKDGDPITKPIASKTAPAPVCTHSW